MLNSILQLIEPFLSVISAVTSFITPIFVFTVVFNSGLSDHPLNILDTFKKNWKYYLRLTLVNCLMMPIAVWTLLQFLPFPDSFKTGVIVFFICAGAPIVTSFVMSAGSKASYATPAMIIQLIACILIIPVLLPILVSGAVLDIPTLLSSLFKTVLVPLILGFLVLIYLPDLKGQIKPYVNRLQKITMDTVIYGVLITNIPNIIQLIGKFAITTGILLVYLGFAVGYLMEKNNPDTAMRDTAAFSIGQRNFAIAVLIVNASFGGEVVLSTVIVYAIGLLQMKHLTRVLSKRKEEVGSVQENGNTEKIVELSK